MLQKSLNLYSTEIDIEYGELNNIIQWCDDNCTSQWTFSVELDAGQNAGVYDFSFASEKDYISFLLWKG